MLHDDADGISERIGDTRWIELSPFPDVIVTPETDHIPRHEWYASKHKTTGVLNLRELSASYYSFGLFGTEPFFEPGEYKWYIFANTADQKLSPPRITETIVAGCVPNSFIFK